MPVATKKNKVKFGLNKVHYAKITGWSEDGIPTFATPKRIPGAVSLTIDAEGEPENFYADDGVYYVINNNAGYTGDLEIALITTDFAKDILCEREDTNGVLSEVTNAEVPQFALLFEFTGDVKKIRHVMYCCSCTRPKNEGKTREETTEVQTETLSFSATGTPLVANDENSYVKSKTCENTDETTYNNWYKSVYIPATA